MKGLQQRLLKEMLHHVNAECSADPVLAIQNLESKLALCNKYMSEYAGEFNFLSHYYKLPLAVFRDFSFDELCKLKYSTTFMMEKTVRTLFDTKPNYEVVRKIMNSMWRWGYKTGTWNEVVDMWNGLRQFRLGLSSDFEIRLDYTTGFNEFGYSKYSRTFIDGVFAFLVYYKQKHVMTIGFSFINGRRILIQQVQLKQSFGNRWLYMLPKNRMEFVIDLFAEYFPNFTFCVVDGKSLAQKSIASYERSMQRAQERVTQYQLYAEKEPSQYGTYIQESKDEVETFRARIVHLRSDLPRLIRFYRNCGRYTLGKKVHLNSLTHHQLKLCS